MIWRNIAIAAAVVLGVAAPAEAGFWGDLKRSLGTAADNARHDGAKAADAVGEAAGDAADAVVEGAGSVADLFTGDSESAEVQAVDGTAEPVAGEPKKLSKQPGK